jgi:hypothetical protein
VFLDPVHRHVGVAQQGFAVVAVARIEADAGRGGDEDFLAFDKEGLGEGALDLVGDDQYVVGAEDGGDDDDEFVTADPGHGVGVAHASEQAHGDGLEQIVGRRVAEAVVDQLEAVEVEQQHTDHLPVAAGVGDGLGDAVVEQVAIGQAGQDVVVGLVFELLFVADAVGDVVDDADEVGGRFTAFVAYRGDEQLVPEQRAILTVIADDGVCFALFAQGGANLAEAFLAEIVAHQEAAILANHFGGGVAGDALEGRIDVGDRVIEMRRRGDHDAVRRGFDGPFAQAQLLFGAFAGADVFLDGDVVDGLAVFVLQWRDPLLFPGQRTVLAPVL